MNRRLSYSHCQTNKLADNNLHRFANNHALVHYKSGAVYSFIPKNGCSTLRLSLAIANGCIRDTSQHVWIHQNNDTFAATTADLIRAPYTFVFLRCPFSRIASVYLDKIVGHTVEAWALLDLLDRDRPLNSLTFDAFIRLIQRPEILNGNIHWRPQVYFLVYEEYDDYFNLADMNAATSRIKEKCGLILHDARPLTRHGSDQCIASDEFESPHLIPPVDLLQAKTQGKLPTPRSLFTEELIQIVKNVYAKDFELFVRLFGEQALMFAYEKFD